VIVQGLSRSFPEDAILAEESAPQTDRHQSRRLWCVDPLDGTREFVEKNGQFSVMIGLAIDGEACLGVVYRPTEDVLYWGACGQAGMMRRGEAKSLRVSNTRKPSEARMMVSRSHMSKTVSQVAERLGVGGVRPLGSVGLKIAELAEAQADLYVSTSTRTHEWDACAPEAILRSAGGLMTDVCGTRLRYNKPTTETPRGMLATNGRLHQACVDALRPVAAERGWS
jgi:3'(2'), 5'-bisphosphate nucleotidase